MDGPRDFILSEVSQRQISYDIAYMWNLMKMIQKSLFIKQTHRFQNQTYGSHKGNHSWGGTN